MCCLLDFCLWRAPSTIATRAQQTTAMASTTTPGKQPHYDVVTTISNTGEEYEKLDGFQQQYGASGDVIALSGPGGGGARRDTLYTNPNQPPVHVKNHMYEAMYAETSMTGESVVDDHESANSFVVPASAPTRESRGWKVGVGAALVVVAVIGAAALAQSMGKSDSDGSSGIPFWGTAAPLIGDTGLASQVASLEAILVSFQGSLNQSLARVASLEADAIAKVNGSVCVCVCVFFLAVFLALCQ